MSPLILHPSTTGTEVQRFEKGPLLQEIEAGAVLPTGFATVRNRTVSLDTHHSCAGYAPAPAFFVVIKC